MSTARIVGVYGPVGVNSPILMISEYSQRWPVFTRNVLGRDGRAEERPGIRCLGKGLERDERHVNLA
jgi:hypothetical protein